MRTTLPAFYSHSMRLPPVPEPPRPAARTPFPVIAVIAPVLGAVVIGLVLSSPFMLLFAALGPIVAVAGVLDGRRSARRHHRLETERFDRECALFDHAIDHAHRAERLEAERRAPHPARALTGSPPGSGVRVGTAPAPSAVGADTLRAVGDSDADRRLGRMLARAQLNPELPALVAPGQVVLEGRGLVAEVIARHLEQAEDVSLYREGDRVGGRDTAPPLDATRIVVLSATAIEVHESGGVIRRVRPEFVSASELATARAATVPATGVPESVTWSALASGFASRGPDGGVPIGVGESGIEAIDLTRAGPHALVGGTTGSGKSELLRALALGWAAAHPPSIAQLLFVDFKGGATFARLTDLPHAIGLVTDLDPVVAHRAVRSLRAELRHRERVLTEAGLRDVSERPGLLPRLLVLVDEFATLIETFPELHAVFSDVAARGRSLGVHLVLCTQHPASVVRDAIAANCPVRLSFRVTEAGSAGMVGDRARELVAAPPGRALLLDEHGTRPLQVAVVGDDDITRVIEQWREQPVGVSTWCAPLPDLLHRDDLPSIDVSSDDGAVCGDNGLGIDSIAFGMLDDPDQRRRRRALWSPPRDGALAVLGASRSGRTTLLATLASGVPERASVLVLPTTVPEAWQVLERLAARSPENTLLVCDGLDLLLARTGDRANEVLARWDAAVRGLRARGGAAVASLGAASAAGSLLAGRFESRVVLRCADADEHAVGGAPRALFDRAAPPGRGWWRDLQVQVAIGEHPLPAAEPATAPLWQPGNDRDAIVITSRVAQVADTVMASDLPHRTVLDVTQVDAVTVDPHGSVATAPRVMIASPSEWQAAWSLLTAARTRVPIVLYAVNESDVRGLLGQREVLPPVDAERGECWLAEPGRPIVRATWQTVRDEGSD